MRPPTAYRCDGRLCTARPHGTPAHPHGAHTCSMPNHGSSLAAFSMATAHAWRVLVGSGFMSTCLPSGGSRGGSYVAHITCTKSTGSLSSATQRRTIHAKTASAEQEQGLKVQLNTKK